SIEEMVAQGASIIDVGAESTRSGSDAVIDEEQLKCLLPIIKAATSRFPYTLFSVDTTKYKVAQQMLEEGVHIINDISGLQQEPRLAELCTQYNAAYVLMHSQGNPKVMQDNPRYENVIDDICAFFDQQLVIADKTGLNNIMLDPGICFGKTLEHNLTILIQLDSFKKMGYPLLVGASRKSMIGQLLNNRPVDDRLAGTISVHYHAMAKGADVIRVHDVKEANDSILVYNALSGK